MFQYSFSLCLVAFFSAILRLSDGRRRRTLLELSTALLCRRRCSTLVFAQESAAGVGSFQPLNGQMRDIKQFALASFSESFAGYSSYLVRFGFTSAPFFFVLRQSILLLYVFPFSCRPLGWSLYLYLFVGSREKKKRVVREGGHAKCLCVRWSILFGAAFRHGFGQDLCSVVGCFYLPFGCVCLHGKCPSVRSSHCTSHCTSGCPTIPSRLSVRPFVCPVYVIAHISF